MGGGLGSGLVFLDLLLGPSTPLALDYYTTGVSLCIGFAGSDRHEIVCKLRETRWAGV